MKRRLVLLLMILSCVCASAQIRNRLGVGNELYLKYANGRIRQFDESNILLADSIYRYGIHKGDSRIKMLALSLELPPRFIRNDSLRVREIVAELKSMANYNTRMREFYFLTMHDYCNMLILAGRISDAMLEARAMSSLAAGSGSNLGQMYAHRVIGLIQSYRSNAELAIFNFKQAADFSTLAKEEQELPVIYNLIAREYIKLGRYDDVEHYCSMAEEFQDFYPSLRVKTLLTKVYLYDAQDKADEFDAVYKELINNPLYRSQTDRDTRLMIEICWLRSRGRLQEALAKSDSLASQKERFGQKHLIYAVGDDYQNAYRQLNGLMATKDSIYIAVQNEDMAILDAELNNARLRLEAQRLKSQQEMSIMLGFILLFMLVTIAILFSQWSLEKNLDNLRDRNRRELEARNAYRKALDSKELENEMKTRILQNRQNKELI
ncbi:MAG: hypothetical protein IKN61_04990 [Bacteroidaceae bacterium]|nr:hypothetical protein [Bacteroidaceae bacterium]